eukprot:1700387-Pyramimonas_sp.AAC.1
MVTGSFLHFPSPALAGGIRDGVCEINPCNVLISTPYSPAPGRLGSGIGIDQIVDRTGGKDPHLPLLSSTNGSGI